MGKQQLNARINPDILKEVKKCAIDKDVTLEKFVEEALKEKLLKEM